MSDDKPAGLFHRIRFYEGRFSNFDLVEPCLRVEGKACIGCMFKHPFCTETGRVLDGAEIARTP